MARRPNGEWDIQVWLNQVQWEASRIRLTCLPHPCRQYLCDALDGESPLGTADYQALAHHFKILPYKVMALKTRSGSVTDAIFKVVEKSTSVWQLLVVLVEMNNIGIEVIRNYWHEIQENNVSEQHYHGITRDGDQNTESICRCETCMYLLSGGRCSCGMPNCSISQQSPPQVASRTPASTGWNPENHWSLFSPVSSQSRRAGNPGNQQMTWDGQGGHQQMTWDGQGGNQQMPWSGHGDFESRCGQNVFQRDDAEIHRQLAYHRPTENPARESCVLLSHNPGSGPGATLDQISSDRTESYLITEQMDILTLDGDQARVGTDDATPEQENLTDSESSRGEGSLNNLVHVANISRGQTLTLADVDGQASPTDATRPIGNGTSSTRSGTALQPGVKATWETLDGHLQTCSYGRECSTQGQQQACVQDWSHCNGHAGRQFQVLGQVPRQLQVAYGQNDNRPHMTSGPPYAMTEYGYLCNSMDDQEHQTLRKGPYSTSEMLNHRHPMPHEQLLQPPSPADCERDPSHCVHGTSPQLLAAPLCGYGNAPPSTNQPSSTAGKQSSHRLSTTELLSTTAGQQSTNGLPTTVGRQSLIPTSESAIGQSVVDPVRGQIGQPRQQSTVLPNGRAEESEEPTFRDLARRRNDRRSSSDIVLNSRSDSDRRSSSSRPSSDEIIYNRKEESISGPWAKYVFLTCGKKDGTKTLMNECYQMCQAMTEWKIPFVANLPHGMIAVPQRDIQYQQMSNIYEATQGYFHKATCVVLMVSPGYEEYVTDEPDEAHPSEHRRLTRYIHTQMLAEYCGKNFSKNMRFYPVLMQNLDTKRSHLPSFLNATLVYRFPARTSELFKNLQDDLSQD